MKYCAHCGAELVKDAKFCVYCGNAVQTIEEKTEQEPIFVNSTPVHEEAPRVEQREAPRAAPAQNTEPKKQVSGADAIPSMVFGILSVTFSFFGMYPVVGLVFMGLTIAFVCVAKSIRRRFVRDYGMDNGFSRAGSITSTVAIPLISLFSFIGIIFTIVILSVE